MKNIKIQTKTFSELSNAQLYAMLALRSEVFVVEQNCVYQDVDGFDQDALHVLAYLEDSLIGYTRVLSPGTKYDSASLGRVVNHKSARGTGLGKLLVQEALLLCEATWPNVDVTISAQHYLEKFYSDLQFVSESEPYLEDDIPHIQMRRVANTI